MTELVLDRQFVSVRACIAAVASTLGVERANVWSIPLVRRVVPGEPLEQFAACTVGFAELERARDAFCLLLLDCKGKERGRVSLVLLLLLLLSRRGRTVLGIVLAVDIARRRLALDVQDRVPDLSRQAKLQVEQASLAAVLGLCADAADLGLLVPHALAREPSEDLSMARKAR